MKKIYLDSSSIIYLIESAAPFHEVAVRQVFRHKQSSNSIIVTSRLSLLECRIKPLRTKNYKLLELYDAFFKETGALQIVDMDSAIVERATHLRAQHNFRTPDAIHIATAVEKNVDVVLSGDADFSRCTDITVEIITGPM